MPDMKSTFGSKSKSKGKPMGPLLKAAIDRNEVYLDGDEYVGRAQYLDATQQRHASEVLLGNVGDEERIESYLKDRPTPADW